MGMDVYGKKGGSFSYNWSGWRGLIRRLNELGVDTSEFKGSNDGDPISEVVCLAVADALEQHGMGEPPADTEADPMIKLPSGEVLSISEALAQVFGKHDPSEWLKEQVAFWRNCGGCEQW